MDSFYEMLNKIAENYGREALLHVYTDGSGEITTRENYYEDRYCVLDFDSLNELTDKLLIKKS